MAIVATNITTGDNTTGANSFTTSSYAPSANHLILVTVNSRTAISANPNQPTLSGNSLTYVAINSIVYDTTDTSGTIRRRLTLFRAMGASPTSGAITVDFAGQTQTDMSYIIDDVTGMNTGGVNGSAAIVQSATNKDETATTGTITATLSAFSNVYNSTYGSFASWGDIGQTSTAGSGFSKTASILNGNTNLNTACEFETANDTTVDLTFSSNSHLGAIGIEIAAPNVNDMLMMFR